MHRHFLFKVKLRHSEVIVSKKQTNEVSDSSFFGETRTVEQWSSTDWQ